MTTPDQPSDEEPPAADQTPPLMDALAAWRCWAVEVAIDGYPTLLKIGSLPAADWLIATFEHGHLSYLPGLLDNSQRNQLMEALADGTITPTQLRDANREALEQASGWRWWQASRLMSTLNHSWAVLGGMLLASGAHPARDPLGMVLGATYSILWQNAGKKEAREKLVRQLMMPPVDLGGEWDEDAAEEALWQMLSAARATS